MNLKITVVFLSLLFLLSPAISLADQASASLSPISVGWIGSMSGAFTKSGALQAAQLAEEVVNQDGGINGRPLKLIYEDGQCNGKLAVSAAQKLINYDKVKFIIGGHCSPEGVAMAPLAKQYGILMLGAISTTPKLSIPDDDYLRLSPSSTVGADLLAPYAMNKLGLKRFAVLYAETDYAMPPAKRFAELARTAGVQVLMEEGFVAAETDFRSLLTRLRGKDVQGIYLGSQSPDTAAIVLRQLHELGMSGQQVFGNEITGNVSFVSAAKEVKPLFEGVIFAELQFDTADPETAKFIEKFKAKYKVEGIPYGIWTAEAYDSVILLVKYLRKCGEDIKCVRESLLSTKDYTGASGKLSIDANGDGVRSSAIC